MFIFQVHVVVFFDLELVQEHSTYRYEVRVVVIGDIDDHKRHVLLMFGGDLNSKQVVMVFSIKVFNFDRSDIVVGLSALAFAIIIVVESLGTGLLEIGDRAL